MQVREAWERVRGEIAQALEAGDLRQTEPPHTHARDLGYLGGGEMLGCLMEIARQELTILEEVTFTTCNCIAVPWVLWIDLTLPYRRRPICSLMRMTTGK
jgi:hypothetical protein